MFKTTAGLISQLKYTTVKKISLKKSYFSQLEAVYWLMDNFNN